MPSVTTKGLPLGRTLKVERVAAGVSLTEMARALGVSIGHLSHIEAGRRNASPDLVAQYRETLRGWAA